MINGRYMKNVLKMLMILLGLCSIAGLIATGVTLVALTGWFDVEARYQQMGPQVAMTYGCITMAFIGLALWLNQTLKTCR
ncbi:hypothetical protein [Pantoea septica]|uniref:hypothetical protein n=1 Tax=Pantoea septica TaxID=472695 RepID=UPI0028AE54DC|nr:hypothetical protein [Pantoea septica]